MKVRISITPNASLHVGNVRTILYAYAYAKTNDFEFIINFDKFHAPDAKAEEIEDKIRHNLDWLDIPFTESGIGTIEERVDKYETYINDLVLHGLAYNCRCNHPVDGWNIGDCHCEEDDILKEDATLVVLKINNQKCEDESYGIVETDDRDVIWVRKKNPVNVGLRYASAFVNTVDDIQIGTKVIFRGTEFLKKLPIYKTLYEAYKQNIKVYHTPLMMSDGRKISKSFMSRNYQLSIWECEYHNLNPEAIKFFLFLSGCDKPVPKSQCFSSFSPENLIKDESDVFDRNRFLEYCSR